MTRYVEEGYFGGQDEAMLLRELYGEPGDQDTDKEVFSVIAACYAAGESRTEEEFYRRVISYMRAYAILHRPGRSFFGEGEIVLELELPSAPDELVNDAHEIELELKAIVKVVNDGARLVERQDGLYDLTSSFLAALRTLGQLLEASWWGDRLPVTTPSEELNRWMNQAMDALVKLDGPNRKAFEHLRRMRFYDQLADYTNQFNDEQHELMAELEDTPLDQTIDFDAFLDRIDAASDDPDRYYD